MFLCQKWLKLSLEVDECKPLLRGYNGDGGGLPARSLLL